MSDPQKPNKLTTGERIATALRTLDELHFETDSKRSLKWSLGPGGFAITLEVIVKDPGDLPEELLDAMFDGPEEEHF